MAMLSQINSPSAAARVRKLLKKIEIPDAKKP